MSEYKLTFYEIEVEKTYSMELEWETIALSLKIVCLSLLATCFTWYTISHTGVPSIQTFIVRLWQIDSNE